MATTIGSLSYQLIADTTRFTQGMSLTRSEISAAKKAMHESKSVVEQYGLATDRLSDLLVKGAINGQQFTTMLNKLNTELRESTGEAEKERKAQEELNRTMQRGAQLTQELLTPQERYKQSLAELNRLADVGAINQTTLARGIAQARTELEQQTGVTARAEAQARQFDRIIDRGKQLFDSTRTAAERYNEELREMSMLLRRGVIDQEIFNRGKAQAQGRFNQAFLAGQTVLPQRPGIGDALLGGAGRTALGVAGGLGLATGASAVTAGVVDLAKHTLTLAANMEQAEVSFRTMLGSADDAQRVLRDLQGFAAQTPFEFPDVTDAATKLVSFRIEQEKLLPTLKALGDLSAGLRIPLGELADIYGRQKSQGRLFAQDLNQFVGRGIPLIAELAKQFGVSESEVRKLVEEGKVGFENLEEALVSLTSEGGQFHDLMKEQSKTMSGLATTLKDEVNLALTDLGATINKELDLGEFLQGLRDGVAIFKEEFLPAITTGLHGVGATVDFVQGGFVEVLRRFGQLTGNDILVDHIENLKRAQDAADKDRPDVPPGGATHDPLAQDFAKELVNLERRRDAIGKSKVETELMQLAESQYSDEQKEVLRGLLEEIRLKEELLGLEQQAAAERKRDQDDFRKRMDQDEKEREQIAKDIQRRNETPEERAVRELNEGLQDVIDQKVFGGADDHILMREIERLQGGLIGSFASRRSMPSRTAGAALERGSAEAFSAILRAADSGQKKNKLEDLPPIAKRQLEVAEAMLQALRDNKPIEAVENNF